MTTSQRILAVKGQRVTSQRLLLLDLVREGGEHLDAEELYRRAKLRQPRLNLSTVYRSLQLFKKLGLVEEHHFVEAHHHYEVKTQAEHHHLICLGCGRVVEFDYPLTEQMKEQIGKAQDFDITGAEVHLQGFCSRCRNKQE